MPLSEIEMYNTMKRQNLSVRRDGDVINGGPQGTRVGRWRFAVALSWLAAFGLTQTAVAASPGLPLYADRDLGDALAQAVQGLGPDAQRAEVRPSATAAACAAAAGTSPRLALLAHAPARAELDRCGETASAEVSVIEIGRQAVAVVAPINSPSWPIDAAALFRALGQNGGDTPRPTTWADIDPAYPQLPIGLLAPPASSRTRHLFDALVMQPGCDRAATARTPFDRKARSSFCSALRSDIPVAERQGGAQDVATWAAGAPAGQVAIVLVSELRQLDRSVVPLLIDGALPTAANIESGRYPAAEKIELLIVVPNAASRTQRTDARDLAFSLLAEASIGPTGSLAPAGLLPLPPPDRIAARTQAVAFLEQR